MSTWMPANCSGLANSGVPAKAPGVEIAARSRPVIAGLAKPRSMIFAVTLLPSSTLTMMLLGLMSRWTRFRLCTAAKTGGCLRHNFQRQLHLQSAGAFDKVLERFPLHKFHRVEVILTTSPEVEDRGNIRMTDAGRRPRLAQETKPCRLITEIVFAYDLQCHGAVQIDVEGFVSDAHRTATQLDRFPVFALHQFVMLKAMR